jgi:hypothetical protein
MVSGRGVGRVFARARAPIILALLVLGGTVLLRRDNSSLNSHKIASQANLAEARAAFGRLPMSFEANRGQADGSVKFLARGSGYGLYLTPSEAALVFGGRGVSAVQMKFAGANPNAQIAGADRLPGHSNYFIGNDPSRWLRNVPQFGRVVYREIYPGVDLAFYGKQGKLEYDFDVAPGADPSQIQLDLAGADKLQVAENGDLVLTKNERELRFQAPHIYQNSSAGQQNVSGAFVLSAKNRVSFQVGDYDRTRKLVIDPVFVFSTYLGGSGQESCGVIVNGTQSSPIAHCPAIAVDSAQRVYLAGATTSTGTFSGVTPATIPAPPLSATNVFVARLNSTGTAVDYVTYLGGSNAQYPAGVAVDGGFNVYIAGTTSSTDFPTTPTAFQTSGSPGTHVFFTKLDSGGSANLYTTYISGSATDTASGLAVDSLGQAYIVGITASTDFPTTPGALQTCPGQTTPGTCPTPPTDQLFFSKLNPGTSGSSSLLYSTYIGGSTPSSGTVSGGAVAVDTSFNVYLAAGTTFTDMPIVNAFQSVKQGSTGNDLWVAKLSAPAANTQQYSPKFETYLGAGGDDIAYDVATDGTNTFVTGRAGSGISTVPAVASGTLFPQGFAGPASGSDAFVAKFGVPSGTGTSQGTVPLSYFTYLGGSGADVGFAVLSDSNSYARVTGWTSSGDFPNTTPLPGSSGGGTDAFIARILTTGTSTSGTGTGGTSSTSILGGGGTDIGTSIALDPSLNMYIAGETSSGSFPTSSAIQSALSGPTDAFVSKLGASTSGLSFSCSIAGCPASNPVVTPTPVNVGGQVTFVYSIYNTGDPVAGVVFTINVGANTTFVSASGSTSGSSCASTTNGTIVCNLGTVGTSSTSTSTGLTSPAQVTVKVNVTTTNLQQTLSVGNSGTLSVPGAVPAFTPVTVSGSALVNDFAVNIAPPSAATVIAGGVATYTAKVSPIPLIAGPNSGFPASVSLSCASGLPAGASCSFTNNPIPDMLHGPQSRTFEITTTARVTTPASLFHSGPTYALWMPILGVGLLGAGISRKRRLLLGAFLAAVLGTALFQAACGGGSSSTTTTGTPAGTYTVTVNATAGATRSTTLQLTVQ